jgi:hypothetical protein
MVVVLFPVAEAEPRLEPSGLEDLAKLGITSLALLRDSAVAGLVLEGWAFDARDAHRAVQAVAGGREGVRMLRPLMQMAVSSGPLDRAATRSTCEQKEMR